MKQFSVFVQFWNFSQTLCLVKYDCTNFRHYVRQESYPWICDVITVRNYRTTRTFWSSKMFRDFKLSMYIIWESISRFRMWEERILILIKISQSNLYSNNLKYSWCENSFHIIAHILVPELYNKTVRRHMITRKSNHVPTQFATQLAKRRQRKVGSPEIFFRHFTKSTQIFRLKRCRIKFWIEWHRLEILENTWFCVGVD